MLVRHVGFLIALKPTNGDETNGSFPPSFQERFAKWSNCFLTRLALKQKCKSVPNHVQPGILTPNDPDSFKHNPQTQKLQVILKRKSYDSLSKTWNKFSSFLELFQRLLGNDSAASGHRILVSESFSVGL